MNMRLIRNIDRLAGPAICQALLLLKSALMRSSRMPHPPKKILVMKFFGLGSILLASPALRAIKDGIPGSSIGIFTTKENRPLCEALPVFDELFCLDISSPLSLLRSFISSLNDIAKARYDIVVDLEFLTNFSAMSALLLKILCGVGSAVGFRSTLVWRNRIYDSLTSFDQGLHITGVFMKVASAVSPSLKDLPISLECEGAALLEAADLNSADTLLCLDRDSSRRRKTVLVNINTGSLSLNRRWPQGSFKALITRLLEDAEVMVFLTGGKSDVPYVEEFMASIAPSDRLVSLAGRSDFRTLLGVLARCDVLVTNDSGPLHLACAMDIPTVSFFGPETPSLYGPLPGPHKVFFKNLPCSPCLNIHNAKFSACEDNICLKSIEPDEVFEAVLAALASGKVAPSRH